MHGSKARIQVLRDLRKTNEIGAAKRHLLTRRTAFARPTHKSFLNHCTATVGGDWLMLMFKAATRSESEVAQVPQGERGTGN